MQQLRPRLKVHQCGHWLTISPCAWQQGNGNRVDAAVGTKSDEGIDRTAFKRAIQAVTGFERKAAGIVAVAVTCTHPAFFGDHHGDGFVHHFDFGNGFFLFLNQRATGVGKSFGVRLNFFDDQAAQSGGVAYDLFKFGFFFAEFFELLLDLDRLQTRQLAQADF